VVISQTKTFQQAGIVNDAGVQVNEILVASSLGNRGAPEFSSPNLKQDSTDLFTLATNFSSEIAARWMNSIYSPKLAGIADALWMTIEFR
jgi:hypothetical protein